VLDRYELVSLVSDIPILTLQLLVLHVVRELDEFDRSFEDPAGGTTPEECLRKINKRLVQLGLRDSD
jgi:hypothetical protein